MDRSLLLATSLLLTLACQKAEDSDRPGGALFDPRSITVDRAAPFTSFDGKFGSVLLGEGWSRYESYQDRMDKLKGTVRHFSWVLDGQAWIYFEPPPVTEVDFVARCLPFDAARPTPQELTLELDGRVFGRFELQPGWQSVRVPLPAGGPAAGWKEMRLRFRHATRPLDVGHGADRRRLSAAFQYIALVPREVEDPEAFTAATRLDPARQRLRLAKGGTAAFPLPARSEVTLALDRMASSWGKCRLRLELEAAGEASHLWEGSSRDAREKGPLGFATPDAGVSRLLLSLRCPGGTYDAGVGAEIPLDPGVLTMRRASERRPGRSRPHVFIYLVDTLRADALTVYGSSRPTSPRVEAFAGDAVTYLDAWSPSAWTLPSVVSLMTGVYPDRHRISLGSGRLAADSFPTLAARLGELGYATAAVSQSLIASRQYGLDRGFDAFYLSHQLNGKQLRSQEVRSYLLQWLVHEWDGERPIFAYVHTVDPHDPYVPPGSDRRFANQVPRTLPEGSYSAAAFLREGYAADSAEATHLRALYDGEVAYADRQIGRFLDLLRHLDLYDDSVVVLLSDHGEEFGEHGGFGHGRTVYEEMLRVPLLVKFPGALGAGTKVDRQVSTVDLLPSVLQLAGGDVSGTALDGRVLPPLPSAPREAQRFTFSEVWTLAGPKLAAVHYRAFKVDGVKCIESVAKNDQFGHPVPLWQGFDLNESPGETAPLPEGDPRLERCRETLGRWLEARAGNRLTDPAPPEHVGEQVIEKLRALGYVE